MERLRAFFKKKWVIIGIVAILIAVTVTTTVLLTTSRDYMRIRALDPHDITQHRVRDYRHSRLFLHDNGTFAIEIIFSGGQEQQTLLVGIGTFTQSGNTFTFTYIDLFRLETIQGIPIFERDHHTLENRATFTFRRSRGRLEFRCPNYRSYFFR